MSDLPDSINLRLPELIQYAESLNITVHVGHATLSQLKDISEYGDLETIALRVFKYFNSNNTLVVQQSNDKHVHEDISKLVNIWKLKQSLNNGDDFNTFIIGSYIHKNNSPIIDFHPGRTRMMFHNVYNKTVPVLIFNYSEYEMDMPFQLELLTTGNIAKYPDKEYRVTPNWVVPHDDTKKYLLVQPNDNEEWHWPYLEHDLTFSISTENGLHKQINANNEPLIIFKQMTWQIVL